MPASVSSCTYEVFKDGSTYEGPIEIAVGSEENYTLSADGEYEVHIITYNEAGKSVNKRMGGKIDKTKPTKPTINIWETGVTIDSGTDVTSGVDKTEYKVEKDGATIVDWTEYNSPLTSSERGTYTIYARTYDNAGNVSDTASKTVTI